MRVHRAAVALLWACNDAPSETPPARHEVLTHVVDGPKTGLATGTFEQPALEYEPIPVDPKYTHVLAFEMTPMMPPSRKAKPSFGPIVLYSDDLDVIVFSPLDHFFVSWVNFEAHSLRSGVAGEVDTLPAEFTHRFLFVEGKGINATVRAWGELLRKDTAVPAPDRYADRGLSHLGYWTDNGAYYYYRTEEGLNEEDTLLAVKADADARKIPFGYFQLDSWWYEKAPGRGLSPYGGLLEWQPIPSMFPNGLTSFRDRLGLPLIAHNRWFDPENRYRDRHPFTDGDGMSLPDSRAPFDELMTDASSWGVFTYEQDWLMPQFWGLPQVRSDVDAADRWMGFIDEAAGAKGLTTQLTMAGAAHFMDAVKRRAVTTVRTSIDYIPNGSKAGFWPQFHIVNMIAGALGLWPFKDNFHSSERWGEGEALVSVLSAGMVGVGDQIEKSDAEIISKTCRTDGVLLKPDRPATPIDAMFLPHSRPFVTTTESRRGEYVWTYVAAYHIERGDETRRQTDDLFMLLQYDGTPIEDMLVMPDRISDRRVRLSEDLGRKGPLVAYQPGAEASVVETDLELPATSEAFDHTYLVLAPIFENGLSLIGEPAKFVTVADRRFERVESTEDGISMTVIGAPDERVELLAFDTETSRMLTPKSVTLGATGRIEVTISR